MLIISDYEYVLMQTFHYFDSYSNPGGLQIFPPEVPSAIKQQVGGGAENTTEA